jgi:hypothetical protein
MTRSVCLSTPLRNDRSEAGSGVGIRVPMGHRMNRPGPTLDIDPGLRPADRFGDSPVARTIAWTPLSVTLTTQRTERRCRPWSSCSAHSTTSCGSNMTSGCERQNASAGHGWPGRSQAPKPPLDTSGGSSFSASLQADRARPDVANPMTTAAPTSHRSSVMAPQPPHRLTNTFDGAGDTLVRPGATFVASTLDLPPPND